MAVQRGEIIKDSTVCDFKMWLLAGISASDLINESFYKKMYSRLAGPKKSGRYNEVTLYYSGGRKARLRAVFLFLQI